MSAPRWMQPFIDQAAPYGRPLPDADPKGTALICVDCQNFFLHPEGVSYLPRSAEMVQRLRPVIDRFRSLGSPVLFTAHGHRDPASDARTTPITITPRTLPNCLISLLLPPPGSRSR